MQLKKQIPNFITLLNLMCGCIALVFVSNENYELTFFFVCLGIFFDFFDGFFARILNVKSELGLQLDSLADMVTSGVVPGFVLFSMLQNVQNPEIPIVFLPYLGFLVTLGSCYRLANFNVDTRQTDSFIGLPTPANSLFIISLPLILQNSESFAVFEILSNQWFLILIPIVSVYMLNAEIPLFSLKIKKFSFQKNRLQILFLITSVTFLLLFRYLGVALVIILYILLSIINNSIAKK